MSCSWLSGILLLGFCLQANGFDSAGRQGSGLERQPRPRPRISTPLPAPSLDEPIDPQDVADELANLRRVRAELLKKYTKRNPDILLLEQEIRKVEAELERLGPPRHWESE